MDANVDKPTGEAARKKWVFPRDLNNDKEQDDADEADSQVMLCSLPSNDALALCTRLESNGIACDGVQKSESGDVPIEQQLIDVMVAEADLHRAREIRDTTEPEHDGEDEAFEKEVAEINADNWICPKCRKRALEILPLSDGWKLVRNWCIGLVVLPIVVAFCWDMVPRSDLKEWAESVPLLWVLAWALCAMALMWIFLLVRRHKLCTECGWRSDEKPD